jgi:hypothetical protein
MFLKRFDLTADNRYTLSQTSLNIEGIKNLYILMFYKGNFLVNSKLQAGTTIT